MMVSAKRLIRVSLMRAFRHTTSWLRWAHLLTQAKLYTKEVRPKGSIARGGWIRRASTVWAEHRHGRRNHGFWLWNVRMVQAWSGHWYGGRPASQSSVQRNPSD
jgi:hypothetical protein